MDRQELKNQMDALNSQELVELGYVKLEVYTRVTKTFTDAFADFVDILTKWSANVAVKANESKNSNLIIFAKLHMSNLKDMVAQRLSKLQTDETHRDV
jgi:hypothetical protein